MQLIDITDTLNELADDQNTVQVDTVVEAFGSRGYGPLLIIPALIEMSPLGGLPGVPTALAAFVVLVSIQMLIGKQHLWLPNRIGSISVQSKKVRSAVETLKPYVQKMDRWFSGKRFSQLTYPPYTNIAAGMCILLALSVPALELFPFASTAPMAVIALVGVAILIHDGLLMIAALSASILSFVMVGFLVT